MASIKQLGERKFKITVSNGYSSEGKKISRAKTIDVPESVRKSSILQHVNHKAEEMEKIYKYGFCEDSNTTFKTYAEKWLVRHEETRAPSTIAGHRSRLNTIYPLIGHIKLCKIKPITLEEMCAKIGQREFRGKLVSKATVQKYLLTISAILEDARKNQIIPINSAAFVELPKEKKKPQVIPTMEEMNIFLKHIKKWYDMREKHFYVFYAIAVLTGARRGEIVGLKWGDIDMEAGTITIARSRSYVVGKGVVEKPPKNGKERVIHIGEFGKQLFEEYKINRYQAAIPTDGYLFLSYKGVMFPDTYSKQFRKIMDNLEFSKEYHLHSLRHFTASYLLHCGVDKQTVAEILGHSDTSFLERAYCHPMQEYKIEAANCMSGLLFGNGKENNRQDNWQGKVDKSQSLFSW